MSAANGTVAPVQTRRGDDGITEDGEPATLSYVDHESRKVARASRPVSQNLPLKSSNQ